ncbi:MAG: STAS domain-containing protein [Clostridiales Family XIII bacterium]|jgi:anti-sigma B factor antagonist|nr:STAS domain-containing protein [Clostridiales Family XIII bacterium]
MALSINANNNAQAGLWEFRLVGEVDISNAHYFKKQLEAALSEKRQSITVDLSDLNYIDSTGLGVIIGAYGTAKKEGLSIKLLNPKDNVKKLLNISGLDKILC